MREAIAADLRTARTEAKLTQGQLAERMGLSQTRVSMAESGAEKVSLAFVKRWLGACGLPEDWQPGADSSRTGPKGAGKPPSGRRQRRKLQPD
jgi:transcriptional regulator with XRE-family HTH domain